MQQQRVKNTEPEMALRRVARFFVEGQPRSYDSFSTVQQPGADRVRAMGLFEAARLGQADKANKLAQQQLEAMRQAAAPQQWNYVNGPPPEEAARRAQESANAAAQQSADDLATEIRRLNDNVDSIARSLARLVEVLDPSPSSGS